MEKSFHVFLSIISDNLYLLNEKMINFGQFDKLTNVFN